jgi:hypothetical protein
VTGPLELAFLDLLGNRQLLSTGNLSVDNRISLFLMDYPARTRLKIAARATILDVRDHPDRVAALATPGDEGKAERIFILEVVSFNWNCPQFITPRFTIAEIEEGVAQLRERIAELEAQVEALSKPKPGSKKQP